MDALATIRESGQVNTDSEVHLLKLQETSEAKLHVFCHIAPDLAIKIASEHCFWIPFDSS